MDELTTVQNSGRRADAGMFDMAWATHRRRVGGLCEFKPFEHNKIREMDPLTSVVGGMAVVARRSGQPPGLRLSL